MELFQAQLDLEPRIEIWIGTNQGGTKSHGCGDREIGHVEWEESLGQNPGEHSHLK